LPTAAVVLELSRGDLVDVLARSIAFYHFSFHFLVLFRNQFLSDVTLTFEMLVTNSAKHSEWQFQMISINQIDRQLFAVLLM